MNWLRVLAFAFLLPTQVLAQAKDSPPPDWMVRGFEAALADGREDVRRAAVEQAGELAEGVSDERVGTVVDNLLFLHATGDLPVIEAAKARTLSALMKSGHTARITDKLLPLLTDRDRRMRMAAVEALAAMGPGTHTDSLIDKLLPLLADDDNAVRWATADALAKITPGERASTVVDKLLPLLADGEGYVRAKAAEALGSLATGERADSVIDKLPPHLADHDMVKDAAKALGALGKGERAARVIDMLVPLLANRDSDVRSAAAGALANVVPGERTDSVIDKLLPLLADGDGDVRAKAAEALGSLATGERAGSVVDKLIPLLADGEFGVMYSAAHALGALGKGERAVSVIDKVLPLLDDDDKKARKGGADALEYNAAIIPGERAGSVIDKLLLRLDDHDTSVKVAVAGALPAVATIVPDERAGRVIDKLLPLLANRGVESTSAARALAVLAPKVYAVDVIDKLLPFLAAEFEDTRSVVARALAAIRPSKRADVIDKLLPQLADRSPEVQDAALFSIEQIGPGGISAALTAVGLIHNSGPSLIGPLRAAAHIATGADARKEQSETLLAWLGRPASLPTAAIANEPARAHEVLALLLRYWSELSKGASLRQEAEDAVMTIVYAACRSPEEAGTPAEFFNAVWTWLRDLPVNGPVHPCWTPAQKHTVEQLFDHFKEQHSTHEQALAAHLAREDISPAGKWLTWSVAGWALLWAGFLVAFPWSPTVQAMFFWNPRVRELLSLWFVPLLLLVFPILRRRLLAPFHDDLVGAAQPRTFSRLGYFGGTCARLDGGAPAPVDAVLAGLSGTVVIRGEAGIGKTSLLRRMAVNAQRPVAFLHARECADGVDVAIARMIHQIQEAGFIRSMVHMRAMIVIIDGLNEVFADTREKVSAFARDMSNGDIFIGTQPIEWLPPKGARIVDLLPLDRAEAHDFLLTRPVGADTSQNRHGEAYAEAVVAFIGRALDEAPTEDDRRAAMLMLSNPFDLSFAADLLAQGTMPHATALIDAAFRLADEGSPGQPGYRAVTGQPFPLVRFGRHAIAMRLDDRNWFKPDEFPAETAFLLTWKLVVPRAVKGAAGVTERIQFRHDRVWDFFIAAAFSSDPELWAEHIKDPRFRGAYLRIAETWEVADATKVRDKLIVDAAESGDHTTSDEFIKRLEPRRRTRKRAKQPEPDPAS